MTFQLLRGCRKLRYLGLFGENSLNSNLAKTFSTTSFVSLKKISEITNDDITVIEGEMIESPKKKNLLVTESKACPLCRINIPVKYTDVLILQQFLTKEGRLLPRRVTGVCLASHRHLKKVVNQSQRAGLMPNLRPPRNDKKERTYPISNFMWKKFPAYYEDK